MPARHPPAPPRPLPPPTSRCCWPAWSSPRSSSTHGYQQLVVDGLGRTTDGMPYLSVSAAIVAASLATVVELVGGLLLPLGVLSRTAALLTGLVVIGGAAFVRVPHGLLDVGGGWALVAAIGGGLAALAGTGPGRCSVAHLARAHRAHPTPAPPPVLPSPAPTAFDEPVPARRPPRSCRSAARESSLQLPLQ